MISSYRVRLPDHDFNVAARHLLCPSVGVRALKRSADYDEKKIEFLPLAERILFEDSLITPEDKQKFGASIPYDLYFPTLQEKLEKRVCVKCFKYHASIKSLNVHKFSTYSLLS